MRGLGKGKGGRVWERERGMVVMVFGREMNRLEWGFLGWVGGGISCLGRKKRERDIYIYIYTYIGGSI